MGEPITDVALAAPAPMLQGLIDRYIGYRYQGFAPGLHRGLPSRQLTFIISLDAPVEMLALPTRDQGPTAMSAFVGGLSAAPALIGHDGTQYGVAIELTPLGARSLLGVPASALAGTVADLTELIGPPANELLDRMTVTSAWNERFASLDTVLCRVMRETPPPAPEVVRAWNCLVASNGVVDVRTLASEVGWSRRHLSERFRAEVGLSPKVMGRVMRFERSRRWLEHADRPPIATVAATCGYYDQAHLTRDWNEFAGCTPTVWMAEELPSVQDALVGVEGR